MKRRIVLLGPPASGKGTLADGLQSEFGLPVVSPGALLRAEEEAKTSLGLEVQGHTREGKLVDDVTIDQIVGHWLQQQGGDSFVFDGYPRTLAQAVSLDRSLETRRAPLQLALLLDASPATLRQRVENRAICSQCGNIVSVGVHVTRIDEKCPRCGGELSRRNDDTLQTLENRLLEYARNTEQLEGYYDRRGLLTRINTERSADAVFQEVRRIIE